MTSDGCKREGNTSYSAKWKSANNKPAIALELFKLCLRTIIFVLVEHILLPVRFCVVFRWQIRVVAESRRAIEMRYSEFALRYRPPDAKCTVFRRSGGEFIADWPQSSSATIASRCCCCGDCWWQSEHDWLVTLIIILLLTVLGNFTIATTNKSSHESPFVCSPKPAKTSLQSIGRRPLINRLLVIV